MTAKHFYGLTGQSNADPSSQLAAEYCLRRLDDQGNPRPADSTDWVTAQWNQGGQEISLWVDAAGNKGTHWTSTINAFDAVIDACKANGDTFKSFTIDWRQGERDTIVYAGDPTYGNYAVKLQNLMDCFVDYYENKCGITPNIILSGINYDFSHPNYTVPIPYPANHQATALGLNDVISGVAAANDCTEFVDISDLEMEDEVHRTDYDPATSLGVGPQIDNAKRVFSFRKLLEDGPIEPPVGTVPDSNLGNNCALARRTDPATGNAIILQRCLDGSTLWIDLSDFSVWQGDPNSLES